MSPETLTILLAEDDLLSRQLLQSYLEGNGHEVVPAENGRDAVNAFSTHSPDLAILDVKMPVMDGMEACRHIKGMMGDHWVPVLMISSNTEEQDQVSGLGVGADYYLTKPISFPILEATVQSSQRIAALQRQIEARNKELGAYYRQSQTENELAQQMFERIVAKSSSNDTSIHQSVQAMDEFSGDMISTVNTRSGHTYAMVADATGHGLPAAITLLPAMEIFYQMSQRGYGIASIVSKINRRMRERLPASHFLAATVLLINPQQHVLYAWNGGCPTAYVLPPEGPISRRIPSAHPPLGVLTDAEFDASVQLCHVDEGDQLFACTDGVTEARNENGEAFGARRLEDLLEKRGKQDVFRYVSQHLRAFCEREQPGDDQSMLAITVEPPLDVVDGADINVAEVAQGRSHSTTLSGWDFELELRGRDLCRTEIVPTVNQVMENLSLDESIRQRAFVVLTELLNNALDHGILGLESAHKDRGGFEHYIEQRQQRLNNLESGFIRIIAGLGQYVDQNLLRLVVTDSGTGFEVASTDNADDTAKVYGRGLRLVASLTQSLRFLDEGATVEVTFTLDPAESA